MASQSIGTKKCQQTNPPGLSGFGEKDTHWLQAVTWPAKSQRGEDHRPVGKGLERRPVDAWGATLVHHRRTLQKAPVGEQWCASPEEEGVLP